MTALFACVVDASVGVKLVINEALSDAAGSLFERMASNPTARQYVPDLFFVECANVLWKHVVRRGHLPREARLSLSQLYELSLIHVPTPTVVPAALAIAVELSISVYDACYVATADLVKAPLVTADERLVRRLTGTNHQACFLGDLGL